MSKRLPEDVVRHWPEVFKDIDIHTIPIDYISTVRIAFDHGKVWEIDCNAKRTTGANLEVALSELFEEYGDSIQHIDFRLNSSKIKRDVQKKTRAFLKNPTKRK